MSQLANLGGGGHQVAPTRTRRELPVPNPRSPEVQDLEAKLQARTGETKLKSNACTRGHAMLVILFVFAFLFCLICFVYFGCDCFGVVYVGSPLFLVSCCFCLI